MILEPKKIKSVTTSTFSLSICHQVMGPDAKILVFCWLFTLLLPSSRGFFSSSSLSAIRVVSSAYLRLLIFLLAILIPVCDSSSPTFCVMYSAYMLNKQDDKIQLCCIPFPILNKSVVLFLVLPPPDLRTGFVGGK